MMHDEQDADPTAVTVPDEAQLAWLRAATGRIIRVQFLQGKTLVGQLLTFDRDTLVLHGAGPAPLLIYKHSITYLALEDQEPRT